MKTVPVEFAVQLSGVTRTFGSQLAVSNVDLNVAPGEIRGLLGPNGAGKTTLLRVVAGLVDQSSGSTEVLGRTWATGRRWLRSQIGWVPAGERSFYLRISGRENLIFFCRLQGHLLKEARREADRLLDLVGLTGAADKRVALYSHGMQRRLALARALIGAPSLLVLDEVTSGLDPEATFDTKEGIRRVANEGTAVLWATQRIEELRGLADKATLLHEGTVRFDGPIESLMLHASGMMYLVEVSVDGSPEIDTANEALGDLGSVAPTDAPGTLELVLVDGAPLGQAIVRLESAGVGIAACRESRDSLELAFLRIVGARQ